MVSHRLSEGIYIYKTFLLLEFYFDFFKFLLDLSQFMQDLEAFPKFPAGFDTERMSPSHKTLLSKNMKRALEVR
jgi:hypothetical protein